MDPAPPPDSLQLIAEQLSQLPNPFADDVCLSPFLVAEASSVNSLNRGLLDALGAAVEDLPASARAGKVGRPLTLITAPRAGYGKTHLVGRVVARTSGSAVAIPLVFRPDSELNWVAVSTELLQGLHHQQGSLAGWSRLRELAAGVFTSFVVKLIEDGRLPCANRAQAIEVLSARPTELFQDGTSAKLIGDWLKRHFGALRKPLAEVARRVPSVAQPEPWVDALFAHANLGSQSSADTLCALASGSRQAFSQLLRLLAHWRPVFVFVDHLDGFYRQEQAGLKIATMLLDLSELPGVQAVLCVNQDLWQSTFSHHLPSAVEDRLTSSQLLLKGLDENEARGLLGLRLNGETLPAEHARKFQEYMAVGHYFSGRPAGSVSARSFLRHAASRWDRFILLLAAGQDPLAGLAAELAAEPQPTEEDAEVRLCADEVTATLSPVDSSYARRVAATLQEPIPAVVESPFTTAFSTPLATPASEDPAPSESEPQTQTAPESAEPPSSILAGPTADFLQIDSPVFSSEPAQQEQESALPKTNEAEPVATTPNTEPKSPFALAFRPDLPPVAAPSLPAVAASALGATSATVAPGAVERLREMMDRLRQHTGSVPPPVSTDDSSPSSSSQTVPPPSTESQLSGRFEALRLQCANEAQHRPLDRQKMRDLIRLAGRRFPLVKYDEVPLLAQPGQSVPRWTLQGMEVFFGLGDFMDRNYWRAVAELVATRGTVLRNQPDTARTQVKLIALKTDRDTLAWTSLQNGNLFSPEIRHHTEALHMDGRSVASLYAMQRIIMESESGAIEATPAQVMSVLARELDFFWKRVTRPL